MRTLARREREGESGYVTSEQIRALAFPAGLTPEETERVSKPTDHRTDQMDEWMDGWMNEYIDE